MVSRHTVTTIRALENLTADVTNGSILPTFTICPSPVDTSSDECGEIQSTLSSFLVIQLLLSVSFTSQTAVRAYRLLTIFIAFCEDHGGVIDWIHTKTSQTIPSDSLWSPRTRYVSLHSKDKFGIEKVPFVFLFFFPSFSSPVNLLTHTKYRLIYVAIFGSMSSVFLNALFGSLPRIETSDPYSQSIVSSMITVAIAL